MRVLNFPFGPYPQRLDIYLAEKGLANIERGWFDPPSGNSGWPPDEIVELSPSGSLPIVVDDDGTVVTASLPILEYLEDAYPEPDMRGRSPAERAHVRQLVTVFDEAQDRFVLWARYGSALGGRDRAGFSEVVLLGADQYFNRLKLAEQMLGESQFLAGDRVTIADCVAMAMLHYNFEFYDVPIPPACKKLNAWYAQFVQRPSVAAPTFPPDKHQIARDLMGQTGIALPQI